MHDLLLQDSEKVEEHFRVLREADMNVAIDAFERGMKLAAQSNGKKGAWRRDLDFALQRAQDGYAKVPRPEQKIKCYDIMCICFLALRKPNDAAISISHTTRTLLQDEHIMSSLSILEYSVRKSKSINKADSKVLELLFNSVCGAIEVCSKDKGWTVENRQEFRKMFRENKHIKKATKPALFQKWKLIQTTKAGAFFWRGSSSGIVRFRETLTDLTHSNASEIYALGSITVVLENDKYRVVPQQTIMYGCLPQNLLMFILLLVLTTVAVIRASSPVSTSPPGILILPVKPFLGALKKKPMLLTLKDLFIGIVDGNLKPMLLTTVKDLFIGIVENAKVRALFVELVDNLENPDWWTIQ